MTAQHIDDEWHEWREHEQVLARLREAVEAARPVPVRTRLERIRLRARLIRLSR